MTDREKIARIIAEHLCQQGKSHKTLYGAERMCYSYDNFAECEKISKCVDALIAAGVGDVTAWKERAEKHRFMALPDGRIKQLYSDEEVEQIAKERGEYKHRAEVAERALATVCEEVLHARYPVESVTVSVVDDFIQHTLKEAEKELAEEG